MNEKHDALLKQLITAPRLTSAQLSAKTGFSVRSIKQYIAEINADHPLLIRSTPQGYEPNEAAIRELLKDNEENPYIQNRSVYLINRLIKHKGALNQFDLCDELAISLSTLKAEFPRIRKHLNDFDLSLSTAHDELIIDGLEKNKRKLLSQLLYHETADNQITFATIQQAFGHTSVTMIRSILDHHFVDQQFYINDLSLLNLVLHIAISIHRIKAAHYQGNDHPLTMDPSLPETDLANAIADDLETSFSVSFASGERAELAILLKSRASTVDATSIDSVNLRRLVGEDTVKLVQDIISSISNYFYIDLNKPDLIIRLSLHIKNLLIRANSNYFSKNPLTQSIKNTSPLLYESSVYVAKMIQERKAITLNDDEIAFLAIHLGSALELQRDTKDKLAALVICPNYYTLNDQFISQIESHFGDQVYITNIVGDESYITKPELADLIIATTKPSRAYPIPYVPVNPFFNSRDLNTLRVKIEELKTSKEKLAFKANLNKFFNPRFFLRSSEYTHPESALTMMCQVFVNEGYVEDDFYTRVMEREKLSSTSFGRLAIPHSMIMNANQTGMYVLIAENGIPWGNNTVNLALLLCISKKDRALFNTVFESLTMRLTDDLVVQKVLKATDYEQFIEILVNS